MQLSFYFSFGFLASTFVEPVVAFGLDLRSQRVMLKFGGLLPLGVFDF